MKYQHNLDIGDLAWLKANHLYFLMLLENIDRTVINKSYKFEYLYICDLDGNPERNSYIGKKWSANLASVKKHISEPPPFIV
jgi:hypothetical protein